VPSWAAVGPGQGGDMADWSGWRSDTWLRRNCWMDAWRTNSLTDSRRSRDTRAHSKARSTAAKCKHPHAD